jgi:hypothetical protein
MAKRKKRRVRKSIINLFIVVAIVAFYYLFLSFPSQDTAEPTSEEFVPITHSEVVEYEEENSSVKIDKLRSELISYQVVMLGYGGQDGVIMTVPRIEGGERIFNLTLEEYNSLISLQYVYISSNSSSRRQELRDLITLISEMNYWNKLINLEIEQEQLKNSFRLQYPDCPLPTTLNRSDNWEWYAVQNECLYLGTLSP